MVRKKYYDRATRSFRTAPGIGGTTGRTNQQRLPFSLLARITQDPLSADSERTLVMDTESTRDLIMKFLEARQANDRDAIFALLTEDAEWRPPLSARMGPFSGRAAVADAL